MSKILLSKKECRDFVPSMVSVVVTVKNEAKRRIMDKEVVNARNCR